ncbi:MAG: L-aspartate oxidase [Capsulimonadaceae bacterium]|nr:L-aspartate oxidase [Capsulimonadaceae bacterium]
MEAYDFLVIGSGSAGLTFALEACAHGTVALVTKKERTDSNTNWAQGGIAGVLGPDDTPDLHVGDTLIAGAGLCDEQAVRTLVEEGPAAIRRLMTFGASFTVDSEGGLSLGREGGHSRRRIVRHADRTGREVERSLVDEARRRPNIHVLEHHNAIDLITLPTSGGLPVCAGAYVLDERSGRVEQYAARATVLATGGCGMVYQHTTNPPIATGDGVAMAWRAGARISNMEFIQFHPTSLYAPNSRSFLISEAVRGEGGVLRRADGTAFMGEYDERKDLAPRDIVARAIDSEMKRVNTPCVYLDITHKDGEWLKDHFPTIYAHCLTFGIDITTDWIPVVPAAHYSCGGIKTDLNGRTNIDRLYACGEAACTGVHGANRLASNSLLEALVYARRSSADAVARVNEWDIIEELPEYNLAALGREGDPVSAIDLQARLQSVMQRYVGIVRSNARLQKASAAITALTGEAVGLFADGVITHDRLEARNLLQVAGLIVASAQLRHESRGLHYTTDYPEQVESEKHETLLVKEAE